MSDLRATFEAACHAASESTSIAEGSREKLAFVVSHQIDQTGNLVKTGKGQEVEDSCSGLCTSLEDLCELHGSGLPHAEEVFELTVFDLLPSILQCYHLNSLLRTAVERFLHRVASTCHPRDTMTMLLGQMHMQ